MMNKAKMIRFLNLSLAVVGFIFLSGQLVESLAQQRDPFAKPGWAQPKTTGSNPSGGQGNNGGKPQPKGPPPVVPVAAPSIEQRIAYYKQLRLNAAENGLPIPKVTSVLTLEEMNVTGIFRTPRGYAAMVEAKPIKLSYTIYPGEKFFDGQLVAVEENRLVFRKVTKMSNNKFIASVENKALQQFSIQEEVQGTAPIQSESGKTESASNQPVQQNTDVKTKPVQPSVIISPLDEMNKQPQEQPKDSVKGKSNKNGKKPVKVAKNKK